MTLYLCVCDRKLTHNAHVKSTHLHDANLLTMTYDPAALRQADMYRSMKVAQTGRDAMTSPYPVNDFSEYANTAASDVGGGESVKYYVLDNDIRR